MEVDDKEKVAPWLPLSGQILFVSVQRRLVNESQLQKGIQILGGKLESFFSRDITCVLTDENPVPDSNSESEKAILCRNGRIVIAHTKRTSVLEKAALLGIQIMRIECFLTWLHIQVGVSITLQPAKRPNKPSKPAGNNKVTRLNACFIKVEEKNQKFCPNYKAYPSPPEIEFEKAFMYSQTLETRFTARAKIIGKHPEKSGKSIPKDVNVIPNLKDIIPDSSGTLISSEPVVNVAKATRQFCECCNMHFSCLEKHLKGPRHTKFISNEKNFKQLELLIGNDILGVTAFREKHCKNLSDSQKEESKEGQTDASLRCDSTETVSSDQKVPEDVSYRKSTKMDESSKRDTKQMEATFILSNKHEPVEPLGNSNLTNENGFLKGDFNFGAFLPSDILPQNDRLFSSGSSDCDDINQDVLNIIDAAFEEESSTDTQISRSVSRARQDSIEKSHPSPLNYSLSTELSFFDDQLLDDSESKEFELNNVPSGSWSVRETSDVKVTLGRCSAMPVSSKTMPHTSRGKVCDSWTVEKVEGTKLTLRKCPAASDDYTF